MRSRAPLEGYMNDMTGAGQFGRHEPVSPSNIPTHIPTHIGSRFNGLAMGTVFQIAGSSSQVLIDAATLQQFAEDADHCIAMAGQIGSQVKMRVGSSWLVANVRALVLDRQAEGLI